MLTTSTTNEVLSEDIDAEYENYQAHLSNLMMMSTLLFGFCVTGTFLSLQFTGDEPFTHKANLVDFVQHGVISAGSSMVVTVLTFVTSSRLAHLHVCHGPAIAVKTAMKTYPTIGIAEMLLFVSLFFFMFCVHDYAILNYMGPPICPKYEVKASSTSWTYVTTRVALVKPEVEKRSSSFCSLLGEDFFEAAQGVCGTPQMVTFEDASQSYSESGTKLSKCLAERSGAHAALCASWDCYSQMSESKTQGIDGQEWFGWSRHPLELTIIGPEGYRRELSYGQMFDIVVKEAGEAMCLLGPSRALVEMACKEELVDDASKSACAQARATYFKADACAEAKYGEADKCRKVCDTVHGEASETLRGELSNDCHFIYLLSYMFLLAIGMGRSVPLTLLAIRTCRKHLWHRGAFWSLSILDIMGVLDGFTATTEDDLELTDEDDSDGDRRGGQPGYISMRGLVRVD
eukprot:TRINITY_DN4259_c0_g1_i4.p1 TRINITY_DN4259_c0_g1~~TRINITY_DN4259_c0_g1_i4.p1  ORF type:complete len:459 (+),score=64.37 TRINITY_DN4259_c0_g1_i4:76-1452(+)